jgi:hypothetical protein
MRELLGAPARPPPAAAGQSRAFSGVLPPEIAIPAGVKAVTIAAGGSVTLGGGEPYSGPDGIPFPGGTVDGRIPELNDSVLSGSGPRTLNFTGAEVAGGAGSARPLQLNWR